MAGLRALPTRRKRIEEDAHNKWRFRNGSANNARKNPHALAELRASPRGADRGVQVYPVFVLQCQQTNTHRRPACARSRSGTGHLELAFGYESVRSTTPSNRAGSSPFVASRFLSILAANENPRGARRR